jgi:hypothetical protein
VSQLTTPIGAFGGNPFELDPIISQYYGGGLPLTAISMGQGGAFPTGAQFFAEDPTGSSASLITGSESLAVANGADGYAVGAFLVAAHNGTAANTEPIFGGYGGLFIEGSGGVPGWSAIYEANKISSAGGAFANVAAFDVPANTFASPGTTESAVLHSLQAPTSPVTYFLLEEGGLPSKLSSTLATLNGTNVIYRCLTAGAARAGALTSVSTDCGTSTDSGLRTP